MVKDPVCGTEVDEAETKAKSEYKGKKYSFCSEKCKIQFDKEPMKYIKKEGCC